jgi:ABC-type histidine transport system ATPase subunit
LKMARIKLMMECNLRSASATAAAKLFKFINSRNCFFSNFVMHSHTTMIHNSYRAQLHLQTVRHAISFLDAFAKLRRTTISFAMSAYPSVRPSA